MICELVQKFLDCWLESFPSSYSLLNSETVEENYRLQKRDTEVAWRRNLGGLELDVKMDRKWKESKREKV